jgi:prevent-host-death family protein
MTETAVSASHFRVHFKDIANSVARGGHRFTVARHGLEMVAVVSLEDLEFLRKHKRAAVPAYEAEVPPPQVAGALPQEAEPEPEMIKLTRPEWMSIEDVEEAYQTTAGSTDPVIVEWRGRAFAYIRAFTGKYPEDAPCRPSG